MTDPIAALAERMWRVHPKELQDLGTTRQQWYEFEIRKLVKGLSAAPASFAEGIEAAAKVAERTARGRNLPSTIEACEDIATAIRALEPIAPAFDRDADCAICGMNEGCDHTVAERRKAWRDAAPQQSRFIDRVRAPVVHSDRAPPPASHDAPPAEPEAFAPCPTCKQYSHSIADSDLAAAFNHFQSMFSHRDDGIPTQFRFDAKTRGAAQVLMAVAIKNV